MEKRGRRRREESIQRGSYWECRRKEGSKLKEEMEGTGQCIEKKLKVQERKGKKVEERSRKKSGKGKETRQVREGKREKEGEERE